VRLLVLLALLVSLLGSPVPAAAQETKLRATLQLPITDVLLGKSLARFKEQVEKSSSEGITVEVFDKGKLYTDDQTVEAVASGKIEMGVAGFNQFAQRIPGIDIMEQPFLFNFEALVNGAAKRGSPIRALVDATILRKVGVRVLAWQGIGNQIFISKGKPTAEPDDIKNRKVRVFSPTHEQFVRQCGGIPVMVGANKTPDAFKSGEIEMATGASSLIANRQLWTLTDRITRTMHAPIEFFLIINENVWQSLPEAHKAVIADVAAEVEAQHRENATKIEAGLYEKFKEKGMSVTDLTADQVADWRACSAGVMETYIAAENDLARQLMAAYGKLRTDPCCMAGPETGGGFTRR
jgi:C4-dicarboxylate-binding protein DctP